MLELGKHLVHELEFQDGVDTLGRWMSHRLSELITESENSELPEDRESARQQATETILRIWHYRASLPGRAYPLTELSDVLTVIARLRPESNPFGLFGNEGTETDRVAATLMDLLTRLVISLVARKLPEDFSGDLEPAVEEAFDDEEKAVFTALRDWLVFLAPKPTSADGPDASTPMTSDQLDSMSIELIDKVKATLERLRSHLNEPKPISVTMDDLVRGALLNEPKSDT